MRDTSRVQEKRQDMFGGDMSEVFRRGTGSALNLRRMNENDWWPNVADVCVWVRKADGDW